MLDTASSIGYFLRELPFSPVSSASSAASICTTELFNLFLNKLDGARSIFIHLEWWCVHRLGVERTLQRDSRPKASVMPTTLPRRGYRYKIQYLISRYCIVFLDTDTWTGLYSCHNSCICHNSYFQKSLYFITYRSKNGQLIQATGWSLRDPLLSKKRSRHLVTRGSGTYQKWAEHHCLVLGHLQRHHPLQRTFGGPIHDVQPKQICPSSLDHHQDSSQCHERQ